MQQLAVEGGAAIDRLQYAFSSLNIKSQLSLDNEKAGIIAAFEQIKNSGVASANEIRRAQEAMHKQLADIDSQLRGIGSTSKTTASGTEQVARGFASIKSVLGPLVAALGAVSFVELAKQAVDSAVKMQALEVQFKTISGSSQMAAANLKFVKDESSRLGLVFADTADSFAKFAASTRGTSMAGNEMRKGFTAVSEAVTAMHLPAEAASRTFAQLSQMMGKGKITAEDMNVIVEAGVVSYSDLAKAMNMTIPEFRALMQSGGALANEILPKLFDHLHNTFGGAALEGAKSTQAQFNLFKNTMFELGATVGQVVLPVVTFFMEQIAALARGISAVIGWLGPFAPALTAVAAAMGLAATAALAYSGATTLAATATGTLTAAMLANPLVIGGAIFAGAVVALKEVIDWFFRVDSAQKKTGEEAIKLAEREKQAAAEKIKVLEDYEAAYGVSLDRQLQKIEATYEKELKAAEDKARIDRDAARGNMAQLLQIEDQLQKDRMAALDRFSMAKSKAREDELKTESERYNLELKNAQEYFKLKGDLGNQRLVERKIELQKEIDIINKFHDDQLNHARGNVVAEIAIEGDRARALAEAKKNSEAQLRIIEGQNLVDQLNKRKEALDAYILLIQAAAANQKITEEQANRSITALKVAALRDQYEAHKALADRILELRGADNEQYKKALKDQESSHKAYVDAKLNAYRQYADQIKRIDQEMRDFRLSIEERIKDARQKTMTDAEKYADDQKRVREAQAQAEQALLAGNMDMAKKQNDLAFNLASRLLDKKKETSSKEIEIEKERLTKLKEINDQYSGSDKKTTDQEKRAAAEAKVIAEYAQKQVDAAKERQTVQEAATNTEAALNGLLQQRERISAAQTEQVKSAQAELQKVTDMKIDPKSISVSLDGGALDAVKSQIAALITPETKTIYIRTVSTGGSDSGASTGYFAGGKVMSGSPAFDSVSAVLARNEWVINNKAASFWGDDVLSAINAPLSAAGVRLRRTMSGQVSDDGPRQGMSTVHLHFPGFAGPIPMEARPNVIEELSNALRRQRLCRPQ